MSYVAPCNGCTSRVVGCHSECEAYKEYRKGVDERNLKRFQEGKDYGYVRDRITYWKHKNKNVRKESNGRFE